MAPPTAAAFATRSSICDRLSHDGHTRTAVLLVASHGAYLVKVLRKLSTSSMTKMFWSKVMQAALSLVNFGSKAKPRPVKKAMDRSRFFTGRLT